MLAPLPVRAQLAIQTLNEFISGHAATTGASWKTPALLAGDSTAWCEITGADHLALHGIENHNKRVSFGLGETALKLPVSHGGGVFLSYRREEWMLSWPFGDDTSADGSWHSGVVTGSAFMGGPDRFGAGVTLGKDLGGGREDWLSAAQIAVHAPGNIRGSAGISSAPMNWNVDARFDSSLTVLAADLRASTVTGEVNIPVKTFAEVTLRGSGGVLNAPDDSLGDANTHAQVIDIETNAWSVALRETALSRGALNAGYAAYTLDGDYELHFSGTQYLRCAPRVDGYRVWGTFRSAKLPLRMTEMTLNRLSARIGLRHGRLDSWPFTPTQLEIVGDKTWTFSGTGRVVLNTATFTWQNRRASVFSLSAGRAYLDYRLRIVTRNHLSADPLEMLFGKSRTETDNTRYADFMCLYYVGEARRNRISLLTEIQQVVPLRNVRKTDGDGGGTESVFRKLKFELPDYYGGLSLRLKLRYFL